MSIGRLVLLGSVLHFISLYLLDFKVLNKELDITGTCHKQKYEAEDVAIYFIS